MKTVWILMAHVHYESDSLATVFDAEPDEAQVQAAKDEYYDTGYVDSWSLVERKVVEV